MADTCCGGTARPGHFHCQGCGSCCTDLGDRWHREAGRFRALPESPLYQLGTSGGLRMFAWEREPFPPDRLEPLLVVADAQRDRLVALAYELRARVCPLYEEGAGCTIYQDRPVVCRSYPLLVIQGETGPEVSVSGLCPAKVPVVGASKASPRPEEVLAGLYPQEAAAALSVPLMVEHLHQLADYLVSAEVIEPVIDLDAEDLATWGERGSLDLVELVEAAGVMTGDELREKARGTRERVRARLLGI